MIVGTYIAHTTDNKPVSAGHENECQDDQTDKFYPVGESWATTTNDCKKSTCVRDGNALYIDRVQYVPRAGRGTGAAGRRGGTTASNTVKAPNFGPLLNFAPTYLKNGPT